MKSSTDPAEIDAARNRIATIKLPAGFKPKSMLEKETMFGALRGVEYVDVANHGHLNLFESNISVGGGSHREIQTRQDLKDRGLDYEGSLRNVKLVLKTLRIKGKDCKVEFTEGDDSETGKKRREVIGVFPGNHGQAEIVIQMDDSGYRAHEIVQMLEAIH